MGDSLLPGKVGRTKSREGTGDAAAQRAGFQGHFNHRTIVIVGFEPNTVLTGSPLACSLVVLCSVESGGDYLFQGQF